MIPIGYMAKHVAVESDRFDASHFTEIFSVSNCISKNFADYIPYWKHNGYWFFDSPEIILEVARDNSIDLTGTRLFFYEVYELEFDDDESQWRLFERELSFKTEVVIPIEKTFEGVDVVTFSCGTSPECSPLSCNGLAREVETNQHCLLPSFGNAVQLLNAGRFRNSEPGPFRVFAVYSVNWP
ncbi:hypothetical protein GC176_10830 [bacterium]|nr:hypothetical protein [bacterium]